MKRHLLQKLGTKMQRNQLGTKQGKINQEISQLELKRLRRSLVTLPGMGRIIAVPEVKLPLVKVMLIRQRKLRLRNLAETAINLIRMKMVSQKYDQLIFSVLIICLFFTHPHFLLSILTLHFTLIWKVSVTHPTAYLCIHVFLVIFWAFYGASIDDSVWIYLDAHGHMYFWWWVWNYWR